MIFSKFFKAKWQHKDSNVRITAIGNLNIANPEDKNILINLAQQDENELVRRTALIKLADFDLWLNESDNNSNKRVKEYAQKQVTQILSGNHQITLSDESKLKYIQNVKSLAGLEAWLTTETNDKLVIALYEKINKPQLLTSVFTQKPKLIIQRYLLEKVTDKSQLEKLAKKACNDEITAEINHKIAEIDRLLELPKALSKKTQLNLSKFLALTDVADYGVMLSKKEALLAEWQSLSSEFDCLTEQEKDVFITKHAAIETQLDKIFAPKAEAYQQKLIADKLAEEQQSAKVFFEKEIAQINQSLTTSIFEDTEVDETLFELTFTRITQQLNESVLSSADKRHFLNVLKQQQDKLKQIPVIAKSVTDATQLIAKISQLALPSSNEEFNERQPIYNDWLSQWKIVEKQASGVLPESITNAQKEITLAWNAGLAPFIAEQKKQFSQVQKKINELKRFISGGRYNIAFGIFKRIEKSFEQLSEKQKSRIQKDFDAVSEKMAELSDWEHYIATPRKQELLEEIQSLVNTPLDNPNDQAAKVKEYRTKWNSLGHADDDIERQLNTEFNEYCEQAFAPCRLYYKEQEKIRELHLSARLAVLKEITTFVEACEQDPVDWKNVDVQLNKFQQQWQAAGEVERGKYKDIQAQYNELVQPIKKRLRAYHDDNAVLKKSLIENAVKASENDDIFAAINTVKDLQNQWKNVGYSGVKHENKLWKEFRAVNDALFKKRDEVQETSKAQHQTLLDQLNTQLDALQTAAKSYESINELSTAQSDAQAILSQALSLKPINKKFIHKTEAFISAINDKTNQIKNNKEKQTWHAIFAVLESMAQEGANAEEIQETEFFNQISPAWKKRLTDVMQKSEQVDRLEDTLMLEIFAGQESPETYKAERMQVQVKLMQEQMVSGNTVDLQASFISWLQKGAINQTDLALIERIKPIYC
ncbi:DUF349 domain-containing protein [Colwellia sp. UCD-KL20]|uniref:DUF349 domain-containing protein n=1 Tax=Colwellia sp. UCD-KL20 TaxID=1917165 RepID=UPI0009712B79|nr:DUF349 domain-containing protein [Colwellia sp. UCD-KL20]